MNSNMAKPEKFGHLHLVYHFTIPLDTFHIIKGRKRITSSGIRKYLTVLPRT